MDECRTILDTTKSHLIKTELGVAIGGISLERLPGVLACLGGANDGAAVVSAVTLADDPQQAALEGLRLATR